MRWGRAGRRATTTVWRRRFYILQNGVILMLKFKKRKFETNQTVRSETADSSGSAGPIPIQPISSLINRNRDRQAVEPAGLFRFLKPWFLNLLIFYPLRPGSSDKGLGWVCGRCQVQVPAGSKRDKLLHYIHSTKSKTLPVFLHNRSSDDAIVLTIRYLSHL